MRRRLCVVERRLAPPGQHERVVRPGDLYLPDGAPADAETLEVLRGGGSLALVPDRDEAEAELRDARAEGRVS